MRILPPVLNNLSDTYFPQCVLGAEYMTIIKGLELP